MNVVVEEAGPCRKKLKIEVPVERVNTEFDSVLQGFVAAVKVPGFRPGRAPRDLVRKRFGREIVKEVKDRLIPVGYRDALAQEKISPVAVLQVEEREVEAGRPFAFEVTLDVPPDFALPEYKGLRLQGQPVAVSPEEVEKVLENIRDAHARYDEVSGRPAQATDLILVDFDGVCDGRPIKDAAPEAAELSEARDFWVHAEQRAFLPGFVEGLIGAEPGQTRQVLVDFPADFKPAALAGRKATYFVKIKAIRERQRPELDEAFVKTLGVESLDELRKRIYDDLVKAGADREQRRLKSELVRHLMEHTRMDLPASMVAEETRQTVHDIVRENTSRGVRREDLEGKREEILNVAARTAEEKLKARYIVHRIADAESIEAAEADVEARVEGLARRYEVKPEVVRASLDKDNRLDDLREQIRFEKTLDALLAQARIET
jgi:trigger factor